MSVVTQEIQDQVSELYIAFFNRAPDAAGFGFWANALASGVSVYTIASEFAKTPEAVSTYGGLTPEQQVNRIYLNVLNRAADPDGLAYWTEQIENGASFSDFAYNFVNAVFVGGTGIATSDTGLVQNKVTVSQYFAVELASNDSTIGATAFTGLTDDPATVTAKEAELDAAVNAGTTYTLTTNIDDIVASNSNDVIIGQFGTPLTANVADQIHGGLGTDELQLYGTLGVLPATITSVEVLNLSGFGTDVDVNVSTIAGVNSLILRNQTTQATPSGDSGDTTVTIAAGQTVTLNNVQDATNTGASINVTSASSVTANTLILDKAGDAARGGNDLAVEIVGSGVKTLNLQTVNNASRISLEGGSTSSGDEWYVETLNITGDKNLTIDSLNAIDGSATKLTINGGTFTGNLDINLSATENFVVTGGTGDDRFNFGSAFNTSDKVNGGDGTNTIAVSTLSSVDTWLNSKTNGVYNNSNIEVLEYTGTTALALNAAAITLTGLDTYKTSGIIAATAASGASGGVVSLDVTNQSNVQTFVIAGNITGGTGGAGASSGDDGGAGGAGMVFAPAINNGSNILNVELVGVTLKGGTGGAGAGSTSGASGGGDGGDGGAAADFRNFETINITSTGNTSSALNTFTGGTGGASGASGGGTDGATGATIVLSANTTVNIDGANAIDLGTISNGNTPVTINAADLSGKLTVTTGTAADVIVGGSGVNVIGLLGNADEVNLTQSVGKADTINVSASTASTTTAFAMLTGFTNAATTGDLLDFQGGATTVLAGNGSVVDLGSIVTGLTGSLSATGILTFGGAGLANATLANLVEAAYSSSFLGTNQDKAIAFQFDGSTYVTVADGGSAGFNAGSDVMVELVGTAGIVALSSTASATDTVFIA